MKVYLKEHRGRWSVTVNKKDGGFRETLGGLSYKEARELKKHYLLLDGELGLLDWWIVLARTKAKK